MRSCPLFFLPFLPRAIRAESELGDRRSITMIGRDGTRHPIDYHHLKQRLFRACHNLPDCSAMDLINDALATICDGITENELERALGMVVRQRIERDPAYSQAATRLLLDIIYREAWGMWILGSRRGLDRS